MTERKGKAEVIDVKALLPGVDVLIRTVVQAALGCWKRRLARSELANHRHDPKQVGRLGTGPLRSIGDWHLWHNRLIASIASCGYYYWFCAENSWPCRWAVIF